MNDSKQWLKEIEVEEKLHRDFRKRGDNIICRYRDEEDDKTHFNILWANTEIIMAFVYPSTPKPHVTRRWLDKDPVGRQISLIIERALSYSVDMYPFDVSMESVIKDFCLSGLGTARVRYDPYITTTQERVYLDETEITGEDEFDEIGAFRMVDNDEKEYEEVSCEPVHWRDFRWDPHAKSWETTTWAGIDHYLSRDELEDQFGELGSMVELTHTRPGIKSEESGASGEFGLVHEIFDKKNRKVVVVATGVDGFLSEQDDPLELEGFYPFPRPMFATTTSGKLIPIADFVYYQDQARELDIVTERIDALVRELKYRGVYDGSFENFPDIAKLRDGQFDPVDDFSKIFNGSQGDIRKVIAHMPLEEIFQVVTGLIQQREQLKQTIYEINGIADIMRGASKASETLGAQQIKATTGSMRNARRQGAVNSFIRDLFRIKAEVIANHFDASTLSQMTGLDVNDQLMQIIRDDTLRCYKIDVETDATAGMDARQEREERNNFLIGMAQLLSQLMPAVQGGMPITVAKELILFGVRGYRGARTLEDAIEQIDGDNSQAQLQQLQEQVKQLMQENQELKSGVREAEIDARNKQTIAQIDASVKQGIAAQDAMTKVRVAEMGNESDERIARINASVAPRS